MTTIADARLQADALMAASKCSPVGSIRANLRRRAYEWDRAVKSANAAVGEELEAEIALAGTLEPGQILYTGNKTDVGVRAEVVRLNWQGGTPSILSRDLETYRDVWVNVIGNTSPLVVLVDGYDPSS